MTTPTPNPRKGIFDAVRLAKADAFRGPNGGSRVAKLDAVLDELGIEREAPTPTPAPAGEPVVTNNNGQRQLSKAGTDLIHSFESCAKSIGNGHFKAYPDPGSRDGKPWTIGWGSTGFDIGPNTIWSQAECDARFVRDVAKVAKEVSDFIGSTPTTQNQFDALVSFHYNTGRIAKATLGKLHKAGNYAGAAAEFGKWIYNDGKVLNGLVRRRKAEADLYSKK